MTNLAASLLGGTLFAAAGYCGAKLGAVFAERIAAFDDGPPEAHPRLLPFVAASCAIGVIAARAGVTPHVLLIAFVCCCLVALSVTDMRRGIVPDAFTLVPLASMFAVSLQQRQLIPFVFSVAVPFVPFALAALVTKGRGMGWGDVKLAAVGGAVLGPQLCLLAFTLACLSAAAMNYASRRSQTPIAFAPYLAASIGIAIPLAGGW